MKKKYKDLENKFALECFAAWICVCANPDILWPNRIKRKYEVWQNFRLIKLEEEVQP